MVLHNHRRPKISWNLHLRKEHVPNLLPKNYITLRFTHWLCDSTLLRPTSDMIIIYTFLLNKKERFYNPSWVDQYTNIFLCESKTLWMFFFDKKQIDVFGYVCGVHSMDLSNGLKNPTCYFNVVRTTCMHHDSGSPLEKYSEKNPRTVHIYCDMSCWK